MTDFIAPSITSNGFSCPHCGTYSQHSWYSSRGESLGSNAVPERPTDRELERLSPTHMRKPKVRKENLVESDLRRRDLRARAVMAHDSTSADRKILNAWISQCVRCEQIGLWVSGRLIWPATRGGPNPHSDTPPDVRKDYEEARVILSQSPRASAALLRLAVDKLCVHLRAKGRTLNDRIGDLVQKGLPEEVQQSLDIARVIGNNAVHAGQIDASDDDETVSQLFALVNFIVQDQISRKHQIRRMYDRLPERSRKEIDKRNRRPSSDG